MMGGDGGVRSFVLVLDPMAQKAVGVVEER